MSTDRDLSRILRSWLHEDAHEDADRVLDLVLDQLETTPQRRASGLARRFLIMNTGYRFAVAAVVVALAAALGFGLVKSGVGQEPSPSPTPSMQPSASPSPVEKSLYRSTQQDLPPGTYVVGGVFPGRFTITLPAGWRGLENGPGLGLVLKTENGGAFDTVPNTVLFGMYVVGGVFTDPCRDTKTASPAPASVDEVVAALTHQVGFEAGPVTDVTFGGLPAKQFDLNAVGAAQTYNDGNCRADFSQWTYIGSSGHPTPENNTGIFSPERLWVVDANGTRLLFAALVNPQATTADITELYAVADSVHFE